jgi:hypothetical protein
MLRSHGLANLSSRDGEVYLMARKVIRCQTVPSVAWLLPREERIPDEKVDVSPSSKSMMIAPVW